MSRENVEVIRQRAAAWRGLDLVAASEDEVFHAYYHHAEALEAVRLSG
jgi:hypothetical protein